MNFKEINKTHEKAMEFAQLAFLEEVKGKTTEAVELFKEAFFLEKEAALAIPIGPDLEPTRSLLFRSAASLAMNCHLFDESLKLIQKGLEGNPPAVIADELHELDQQVHEEMKKEEQAALNSSSNTEDQNSSDITQQYIICWWLLKSKSAMMTAQKSKVIYTSVPW